MGKRRQGIADTHPDSKHSTRVENHASALLVGVALALLAGCSSAPSRERGATSAAPGGYYLDDGPGANPPADLDQIPDAQPRPEPVKASTARPYTVFGATYTPMGQPGPYKARGLASWYGRRYHGKPTASGELYDMYAMTAAHPTLPIPSYARVTNLRTGKAVVVRINDRGPFHSDRLIDLSYAAAHKLGIVQSGRDTVEVEAVLQAESTQSLPVDANASAEPRVSSQAAAAREPESSGVYIQLGAFSAQQNAEDFLLRLRADLGWLSEALSVFAGDGLYRIHAGPYPDRDQASKTASRIEQTTDLRPVIILR